MLLETICFLDGQAQHLQWHQVRLDEARWALWHIRTPLSLADALTPPAEFQHGKVKCRVLYDYRIHRVEWMPYIPARTHTLQLVEGSHLRYPFKYADRSEIRRMMALRGEADDILIVQDGLITDTSYCNVVCFDGQRYFTPAQPLLPGTSRARLLHEQRLDPADIRPQDLHYFQHIFLINAMLDLGECIGIWNKNLTFAALF